MAGIEQQATRRAFPTRPGDRPRANRSLAAFRGLTQPDTPPPHWDALVRTVKAEVVPPPRAGAAGGAAEPVRSRSKLPNSKLANSKLGKSRVGGARRE